nr:AlNc14C144G7347 [Albugo laibachii Nc14]|eukprot:CCA22123.1 AlNc14C144G7347 [Albugo laibachii Nc14]
MPHPGLIKRHYLKKCILADPSDDEAGYNGFGRPDNAFFKRSQFGTMHRIVEE